MTVSPTEGVPGRGKAVKGMERSWSVSDKAVTGQGQAGAGGSERPRTGRHRSQPARLARNDSWFSAP